MSDTYHSHVNHWTRVLCCIQRQWVGSDVCHVKTAPEFCQSLHSISNGTSKLCCFPGWQSLFQHIVQGLSAGMACISLCNHCQHVQSLIFCSDRVMTCSSSCLQHRSIIRCLALGDDGRDKIVGSFRTRENCYHR